MQPIVVTQLAVRSWCSAAWGFSRFGDFVAALLSPFAYIAPVICALVVVVFRDRSIVCVGSCVICCDTLECSTYTDTYEAELGALPCGRALERQLILSGFFNYLFTKSTRRLAGRYSQSERRACTGVMTILPVVVAPSGLVHSSHAPFDTAPCSAQISRT